MANSDFSSISVLIPAYNPGVSLLDLVESLQTKGFGSIIVVDDGSNKSSQSIFCTLESNKSSFVLRHSVNMGKGRALKTGMNYFYLTRPNDIGLVTVDADGQHVIEDIVKVTERFLKNQKALVIGSRQFDKRTPLRSLLGNIVTRYVFGMLVGKKVSDTQSGLRCIPKKLQSTLIVTSGERYEYEMNVLIMAKENSVNILEEPISTIYIDGNKSSHFSPIIDSMKIYFLIIRFSFSSIFAGILDLALFGLTYSLSKNILTSIVVARLISGNINFVINKKLVFHNNNNVTGTILKYYILFVIMGYIAFV